MKYCPFCKSLFSGPRIYCSQKCYFDSIRPEKIHKICEICHKKFCVTGTRKNARFCSNKCKGIWLSSRRIAVDNSTCLACGKRFHVPPSIIKKGYAKYCSWKCRTKYMRGRNAACPYTQVERECETCGKHFSVNKYKIEQGIGRFCSMECMVVWRSKEWVGANNPNWRDAMTDRTCQYCGKQFMASKKQILGKHAGAESCKFCSRKCANLAKIRSGSTPYRGYGWPRQRRLARKRDDYRCRICGSIKTKKWMALPVHHIVPFRLFQFKFGKNENDKLANSLNNLLTLCTTHHGAYEGKPPEFFRPYLSEEQYLAIKELEKFVSTLATK